MDRRAWWATGPQGRKESDTTDHPRTWSTGWDGICNRNLPVLSGLILINPNKHLLRTYYIQEKAMTPHSSTLPWRIPWTEEPGRLQSMGLLRSDTTEWLHFHFSLSCIGEGNGNPLQCSYLENPRDIGAWWAAVHGVAEVGHNWATSLSLFTFMHWRRKWKWQPTPVFLPGESQGRGSLVGCHLWGCTESDTTEAT